MQNSKWIIGAIVAVAIAASTYSYKTKHSWPEFNANSEQIAAGEQLRAKYIAGGLDASKRSQAYTAVGDYMNYSKTVRFKNTDRIRLDKDGIPMVLFGTEYHYNPITVSHYAFSEYGSTLPGKPGKTFWNAVDKLMSMQSLEGAFRYDFRFKHYALKKPYPPGWVSGMAQGTVLSVYARAYNADPRPEILQAGNDALRFLTVPTEHGGPFTTMAGLDPSLKDYIFFEEYIGDKNIYTLNGYMFTLLGLYDWWIVTKSEDAKELFNGGIRTLEKILPYYDFGGFSAYDLAHITYHRKIPHAPLRYHSTHLSLLNCLYSVTNSRILRKYADHWQESVTVK